MYSSCKRSISRNTTWSAIYISLHRNIPKFDTVLFHSPARHPQKSSQHVRACAAGDGPICSKIELLSHIMGTTPILEMARAYGLRPRLWLLFTPKFLAKRTWKSLTLEPSVLTPNLLDHKIFIPLSKFPEIKSCPFKTKINWKKFNPSFMGDYKRTAISKQMI